MSGKIKTGTQTEHVFLPEGHNRMVGDLLVKMQKDRIDCTRRLCQLEDDNKQLLIQRDAFIKQCQSCSTNFVLMKTEFERVNNELRNQVDALTLQNQELCQTIRDLRIRLNELEPLQEEVDENVGGSYNETTQCSSVEKLENAIKQEESPVMQAIEQEGSCFEHAIEQEGSCFEHAIEQEESCFEHAIEQEESCFEHAIEQEESPDMQAIEQKDPTVEQTEVPQADTPEPSDPFTFVPDAKPVCTPRILTAEEKEARNQRKKAARATEQQLKKEKAAREAELKAEEQRVKAELERADALAKAKLKQEKKERKAQLVAEAEEKKRLQDAEITRKQNERMERLKQQEARELAQAKRQCEEQFAIDAAKIEAARVAREKSDAERQAKAELRKKEIKKTREEELREKEKTTKALLKVYEENRKREDEETKKRLHAEKEKLRINDMVECRAFASQLKNQVLIDDMVRDTTNHVLQELDAMSYSTNHPQIREAVETLTSRTIEEMRGTKVAVASLTRPGEGLTVQENVALSRFRGLCQNIFKRKAPKTTYKKQESGLADQFLYFVMQQIHTELGMGVFTIDESLTEGKFFLQSVFKETKSSPVKSPDVTLDDISFWIETGELKQAVFSCFPRLNETLPYYQTDHFKSVREDMVQNFQVMQEEAGVIFLYLRIAPSTSEKDIWGLPMYTLEIDDDDSPLIVTVSQATLLVWYLNGKLGKVADLY